MERYFKLSLKDREDIQEYIKKTLPNRKEIIFAYLYGSFLDAPSFKDIDLAVFVDPAKVSQEETLDYELRFPSYLKARYPVDVRVLNFAPKGFQNNVARSGKLLFSKDDDLLAQFLEFSSLYMLVNAHVIRESFAALSA